MQKFKHIKIIEPYETHKAYSNVVKQKYDPSPFYGM
jgi:hypothetical protein